MADFGDFYPSAGATAPPRVNGSAVMPGVQANGSFSQSASGSVAAQGAPAFWVLVALGAAFILLHLA